MSIKPRPNRAGATSRCCTRKKAAIFGIRILLMHDLVLRAVKFGMRYADAIGLHSARQASLFSFQARGCNPYMIYIMGICS